MRFVICLILTFSSLQAMSRAPRPVVAENIGVRTLKYQDEKRGRPVVVELWHPTRQAGPFDEPVDPVWVHPKEIRDAPISEGKHSLIIMSHGHGGDRRDRSWLAEHLVRNGFIVASVEHYGNSWRSYNLLTSLRFWERARDISYTITQLLKDPELQKTVHPRRIGFVGYSLGGMTGLALAGARAQNVKEVVKQLQQSMKEIDSRLIEQVDFSEAQGNFVDSRIRAMVLLSPATFIFPPQTLKSIKIPVALVASENDEILPFRDHAAKIITHLVPRKLKLFREVSHHVWLNRVSEAGKGVVRQDLQTDALESDRLSVHKEVGSFVVEFFKEQL